MIDAIYISIKPQYTTLIKKRLKNYEFRNYKPKQDIKFMYVYESSPTSCLKYIMEVEEPIKYPDLIDELGNGNNKFNQGSLGYKYAFKIKHLYIFNKELSLKELKDEFNFRAPQAFAYSNKYNDLTEYINKIDKEKLY